jgi:hypothetical protein
MPYLHKRRRKVMTQGTNSREEAVAAIRSVYEFFTKTPSLDPSDIEYPPPEGWPEINAHSMAGLNKTDDVIELLKHLPYTPWSVQIAYQTHTIDYTTPDIQNDIEKARLEGHIVPVGAGVIPEHVVPLTMGGIYGSALLLDTKKGSAPIASFQDITNDIRDCHRYSNGKTRERDTCKRRSKLLACIPNAPRCRVFSELDRQLSLARLGNCTG